MSATAFASPGRARPRRRYRSAAIQIVVITAMLGLVAVVIAGVVPGSSGRLRHASIAWIAVALVAELLACAAYAWLFHGVFSHRQYRLGRGRSAQIALGELAGFVISPTGMGGPALRIWALIRSGMPFRVVISRGIVHYIVLSTPYIVTALFLGIGALIGVGVGHAHTALALAPLGVVLIGALVAIGASLVARGPARSRTGWRKIGRDTIEAIPAGTRQTPRRLRSQPGLLLPAIAYWAADCGVLVIAFHAAHGSAPISVITLAYMLGQLGNALPLPGGVGGVEPAMLGVLTSSGVPLALGATSVVLYRFISLGIQSITGAAAASALIPSLQRQHERPEPEAEPEELGPQSGPEPPNS